MHFALQNVAKLLSSLMQSCSQKLKLLVSVYESSDLWFLKYIFVGCHPIFPDLRQPGKSYAAARKRKGLF